MSWLGLAAVILLIISCFTPWIVIDTPPIVVSGVDAGGTTYGKAGYLHFVLSIVFLVCLFVPRIGFKRLNVAIGAINLAWAIRNFLVIGNRCEGGVCPVKQWGIYCVLLAAVLMLVATLFPHLAKKKETISS